MGFGLGFAGGFAHAATESAARSNQDRLENAIRIAQLRQSLQEDQLRQALLPGQLKLQQQELEEGGLKLETGKQQYQSLQSKIAAGRKLTSDPTLPPRIRQQAGVDPAGAYDAYIQLQTRESDASTFQQLANATKDPAQKMAFQRAAMLSKAGADKSFIDTVLKPVGMKTDEVLDELRRAEAARAGADISHLGAETAKSSFELGLERDPVAMGKYISRVSAAAVPPDPDADLKALAAKLAKKYGAP